MTDRFKFGAHQFLWKSHWTDADLPILDAARSFGLTLLEISLGDDVQFDRARVRRHAQALGLELSVGPGNVWPDQCNISADDPRHRQLGLAWHKKVIDWSAQLGAAAYCRALRPPRPRLPPPSPADELARAAETLHLLADYAGPLGVRVVIEPMSRFRLHLVNTASQAADLVRLADHANLRVNLDTFHMITEERDYDAAIRCAAAVLWGVHACENDRGVPGGGLVPWPQAFAALAGLNGPIRLMLETYNTGPADFGFSRGIFQDLCPNPETFIRQGLAFLQRQIQPGNPPHA